MRGPLSARDVDSGLGVVATDGGRAELLDTAVVGNRTMGLLAQRRGEITAASSVVRDTLPALGPGALGDALYGLGAAVLPGARLTLSSSAVVNNRAMGIFERGEGASVTLTGVLIDRMQTDENGAYGRGINTQDGSVLDVRSSAILHAKEGGVVVFGSYATIADSTLSDTEPGGADHLASSLVAALGARLEARGTTVASSADIGVVVSGWAGPLFSKCLLSSNPIALNVQDGSTLEERSEPSPDQLTVVVSPDTHFVGRPNARGR